MGITTNRQRLFGPRWLKMLHKKYVTSLLLLSVMTQGILGIDTPVTIHGGWSPWSKLETDCVRLNETTGAVIATGITCGGGVKIKTRSCTNPVPQGVNPKSCAGAKLQSFPCNTSPCGMRWSSWSGCSEECGRGFKRAWTECQANKGDPWVNCSSIPDYKGHHFEWVKDCNTWNRSSCPSPCEGYSCPDFADCQDLSTDTDPKVKCACQMGRVFLPATGQCIKPLPTPPTPRPIPTLSPGVKTATTAVTKSASSLLIIFVGITLVLFAFFRIYDIARVIHMNMEIALICAHICLIIPDMTAYVEVCRVISILTHFFFLACFMFMLLEALHVYVMVASIVHKDGMFSRLQNTLLGWGIAAGIILVCVALQYENYGAKYHCWLQMDTNLMYAQYVPITILVILIFALIEAAASADDFEKLPTDQEKVDFEQLTSAKIMQRTSVLIMPMVFATFICGTFSEYQQNVYLYGIFTTMNTVLGVMILLLHSSSNQTVRKALKRAWRVIITKR